MLITIGRWSESSAVSVIQEDAVSNERLVSNISGDDCEDGVTLVEVGSFKVEKSESSISSARSVPRASLVMFECQMLWWAFTSPIVRQLGSSRRWETEAFEAHLLAEGT